MTPIVGYLKLLIDGGARGSCRVRRKKALKAMHDCVQRLRRLIESLLDVTALETGRMRFAHREFDLAELVHQSVARQPAFDDGRLRLVADLPKRGAVTGSGDVERLGPRARSALRQRDQVHTAGWHRRCSRAPSRFGAPRSVHRRHRAGRPGGEGESALRAVLSGGRFADALARWHRGGARDRARRRSGSWGRYSARVSRSRRDPGRPVRWSRVLFRRSGSRPHHRKRAPAVLSEVGASPAMSVEVRGPRRSTSIGTPRPRRIPTWNAR